MSSINGVELKNVKAFRDHEGFIIYQGIVVIDGKIQGDWSMSYMNGPDNYGFDTSELEKRAKQYFEGIPDGLLYPDIFKDPDILLYQLLNLQACEDLYNQTSQAGASVIITRVGPLEYVCTGNTAKAKEALSAKLCPEEMFFPKSLSDFSIIVDKEHPADKFWFEKALFQKE